MENTAFLWKDFLQQIKFSASNVTAYTRLFSQQSETLQANLRGLILTERTILIARKIGDVARKQREEAKRRARQTLGEVLVVSKFLRDTIKILLRENITDDMRSRLFISLAARPTVIVRVSANPSPEALARFFRGRRIIEILKSNEFKQGDLRNEDFAGVNYILNGNIFWVKILDDNLKTNIFGGEKFYFRAPEKDVRTNFERSSILGRFLEEDFMVNLIDRQLNLYARVYVPNLNFFWGFEKILTILRNFFDSLPLERTLVVEIDERKLNEDIFPLYPSELFTLAFFLFRHNETIPGGNHPEPKIENNPVLLLEAIFRIAVNERFLGAEELRNFEELRGARRTNRPDFDDKVLLERTKEIRIPKTVENFEFLLKNRLNIRERRIVYVIVFPRATEEDRTYQVPSTSRENIDSHRWSRTREFVPRDNVNRPLGIAANVLEI